MKCEIRAVIVHHQVVDAEHAVVRHDRAFDVLDQLGVGRTAEQRVDGVAHEADAAPQDEERNRDAHPRVELETREMRDQRRDQHGARGDHIVARVSRRGNQRLRIDEPAQLAVEHHHPQLDRDGERQNDDQHPAEFDGRGRDDLLDAAFEQLDADDQDEHGDDEAGQILEATVAIGMVAIRRFRGKLETEQADDVACRIGQVVHAVRDDGNRPRQKADEDLGHAQDRIADDADSARERTDASAHLGILRVGIIRYEMIQQALNHRAAFPWDVCARGASL